MIYEQSKIQLKQSIKFEQHQQNTCKYFIRFSWLMYIENERKLFAPFEPNDANQRVPDNDLWLLNRNK